ncbi:MAG: hypothetical protein ACLQHS_15830 [Candidatus Limnocylindrales bacterium]
MASASEFAVRTLCEVDIAEGEHVFAKPGVGRVARLPVATTTEDENATSGFVELHNHAVGASITLSPRKVVAITDRATV